MQKITPFLWFNTQAEQAMNFYVSVFKNSKVISVTRYGEHGTGPAGEVMSATMHLDGQDVMVLNGGPQYTFSPALSLFVNCETQAEVDALWTKLSEGGQTGQCGWLQDTYGVSWQIVPTLLGVYLNDPDSKKANNVMRALLEMDKIDIQGLRKAYQQSTT